MKRITVFCLALMLLFTASGCKEQKSDVGNNSSAVHSSPSSDIQTSDISSVFSSYEITENSSSGMHFENSSEKESRPAASSETPSETESKPVYTPTLDYHYLPDSALDLYSNADFSSDDISLYHKIVDAYLNFETSVPFDTAKHNPHGLLYLLRFHCPVFFADTYIDVDYADYSTNRINITYTSETAYEHGQVIKKFEDACKAFIGDLGSNDTETERALICYHRLVKALQYDYRLADASSEVFSLYAPDNLRYNETYVALTEHTGVCSAFAVAYNFLLSQLDIDAYTVYAEHKSEDIGHSWSMLKLNDKWFFADPTWDVTEGDSSIIYFGTQSLERVTNGYLTDTYRISNLPALNYSSLASVKDFRFAAFSAGAHDPVFDRENDTVTYTDKNGEEKTFDLK